MSLIRVNREVLELHNELVLLTHDDVSLPMLETKDFFSICSVLLSTKHKSILTSTKSNGINGNEQKMTVDSQTSRCFNHECASLIPVPAPTVGIFLAFLNNINLATSCAETTGMI